MASKYILLLIFGNNSVVSIVLYTGIPASFFPIASALKVVQWQNIEAIHAKDRANGTTLQFQRLLQERKQLLKVIQASKLKLHSISKEIAEYQGKSAREQLLSEDAKGWTAFRKLFKEKEAIAIQNSFYAALHDGESGLQIDDAVEVLSTVFPAFNDKSKVTWHDFLHCRDEDSSGTLNFDEFVKSYHAIKVSLEEASPLYEDRLKALEQVKMLLATQNR